MYPQKVYPLIIGGLLNAHSDFYVCGRTGALSTCHTWRAIVWPDVELQFGGPGQKALQTMNEFTVFVDFCLIFLKDLFP